MDKDIVDRFNAKWVADPKTGCWNWTATCAGKGYGILKRTRERRYIYAHRLSFEIHKGPVGDKQQVCHSCDNTKCVNPEHLFVGSSHENHLDMKSKGRHLFGEKNAQAKLSEEEVRQILVLLDNGIPQTKIGEIYGVSQTQIGRISRGERWSNLTDPAEDNPNLPDTRRNRYVDGEKNGNARLSALDVNEIRVLLKSGASQRRLSERYGVSQMQICRIGLGKAWAHTAVKE